MDENRLDEDGNKLIGNGLIPNEIDETDKVDSIHYAHSGLVSFNFVCANFVKSETSGLIYEYAGAGRSVLLQ
jgi:hypothetical protein